MSRKSRAEDPLPAADPSTEVRTARYMPDPHIAGLGTRYPHEGEPEWTVAVIENGRLFHRPIGAVGDTPRKAAVAIANQMATVNAGTFPDMPTVAAVAAQFLQDREASWARSTYRSNAFAVRHFGDLGRMPITEISRQAVTQWHRTMRSDRNLSILSQVMRYAEQRGLRPDGENPCKKLRKKRRAFKACYPAESHYRGAGPALLRRFQAQPAHANAVLLIALTGARHGEILGMRWHQLTDQGAYIPESKTGKRFVVFCRSAREILRRLPPGRPEDLVIRRPEDGSALSTGAVRDFWRHIKHEAGLPRAMRIHDLRHGFASTGVNHGEELTVVGQLLGHRDYDSTLAYAHLSRTTARGAAEQTGRRLRAQLSGRNPSQASPL